MQGTYHPLRKVSLRKWLLVAIVALCAFALYSGVLAQGFVADDFIFLHQLRFKQPGLSDNLVFFTRDWGMGAEFYRPLTRLYWALLHSVVGETAWAWHLAGAVLYAITCALVLVMALRLSVSIVAALPAALIFATHPTHAETVSWLANSSDLLASFFCVLALLLYIASLGDATGKGMASGSASAWRRGSLCALSPICFFAALMSKESAAGFFLIPILYDVIFGVGKRRDRRDNGTDSEQTTSRQRYLKGIGGLMARQLPFIAALAIYGWLRLNALGGIGGYAPLPGSGPLLGESIAVYIRWLILPLTLDTTLRWLLFALALAALVISLFCWERRASRAPIDGASGVDTSQMPYALTRTALFGLCWTVLFLAPTATTPPSERFVYISTVGVALFWGALLSPTYLVLCMHIKGARIGARDHLWQTVSWLKLAAVAALVILSILATLPSLDAWLRAGQTSHNILVEIRDGRPEPAPYTPIYAAGLPQTNEEALIFRTGFPEAIQLLYGNSTVQGIPVDVFPVVEQRLNEAYFVEYRAGRIIPRDDIVASLQERNREVKAKEERPFQVWDTTITGVNASSWQILSGKGNLISQPGGIDVNLPEGGFVRPGSFSLPAPALSWTELTLRGPLSAPDQKAAQLVIHWMVDTPGGPVERASAPLAVALDNETHTYRVKPADMSVFFLNDTISEVRIELPTGIAVLTFEGVRLFKLPWQRPK